MSCFAGRLAQLPIWAFHGALDVTVPPSASKQMVDAVNRAGGNAKLTVYPGRAHDCWTDTFSNPEVFAWLLQQRRQAADLQHDALSQFVGPETYG